MDEQRQEASATPQSGETSGARVTEAPPRTQSRVVPIILGIQAALLAGAAIGAFGGIGVGSTALRVGVGVLLLVLAAGAAGIAISYSEGQPTARTAAAVFEAFALGLVLLWFAPIPALVASVLAGVVLVIVMRHDADQIRRPVPSQ